MKTHQLLLAVALLAAGAMVALPTVAKDGKSKSKTAKPVAHKALFDSFTYSGNDAIYDAQKLTSDDAFYNPILPGWYSDPSICRVGGDYFLITSTFSYYPGVPIFHSTDLINWRQIGHVLDRPSQLLLNGQSINNGGIYAPAIAYNPHNQTYYMITTNVGVGNFFVKTKDPFGSWSDPVVLPEVNGIDPSLFFDDDGRAYIVHNDEAEGTPDYDGHRTIRIHEFDVDKEQTIGASKVIVDKGVNPAEKPIWIEGPHLYKINGKYYLMAAEGGTGDHHSEVIFRSDSVMGTYVPAKQNPILTQRDLSSTRPNPVTCTGHADLVQTPQGDWWAVFLGCRPYKGEFENLGRETFLMPVSWSDDGWPVITREKQVVPLVQTMPGAKRGAAVTFGNFTRTDDFTTPKLGLEWLTLRGPATDLYSLTDYPGYLALSCADVSATEQTVPAYIGRRIQHSEFSCETTITFSPADTTETAGLLLFKNETHHYYLCIARTATGKAVQLRKMTDKGTSVVATKPIPKSLNTLKLKVVSTGLRFNFYYSAGKDRWIEVATGIDAGYLSTRYAGGFTGTTVGVYATCK